MLFVFFLPKLQQNSALRRFLQSFLFFIDVRRGITLLTSSIIIMLASIYEKSLLEEQIRDAEKRRNEGLRQMDVVDKQIRDLEVIVY